MIWQTTSKQSFHVVKQQNHCATAGLAIASSTPKHLFLDATILWRESADQIESTDIERSFVQTQINASRCKQSGNNNGAWKKQRLDTLFNLTLMSNYEQTYFDVLAFAISFCRLLLFVGFGDAIFNTLSSNYCSTSNENWLSVAN